MVVERVIVVVVAIFLVVVVRGREVERVFGGWGLSFW